MYTGKLSGGVGAFLFLATVVLTEFWPAEQASAAGFTWSGADSAADLNWSDTANWSPAGPVSGGSIAFNNTGGTTGATTTSAVDQSFTISSLTFTNSGATAVQNLVIGSTASPTTLTVNGAGGAFFGSTASTLATTVSISGTGAFAISNGSANFSIGPGNTAGTNGITDTLSMSGLSSFTFSGSNFNVGVLNSGSTRTDAAVVQLASSSSITATGHVDIGDSGGQNNVNSPSILDLSTGANTIYTNTLYVGRSKVTLANLVFASTASPAPAVTIGGSTGGSSRVTTIDIGDHNVSASSNTNGTIDFSSGQVNAMIGTLIIGADSTIGTLGGSGSGTFIMGPNPNSLVDVNTVSMGLATTSSLVAHGALLVEGGTLAFGSIGVSANQAATVSFSGGSTICSNTASSTETPAFNLGSNGVSSTVTFGALAGTYTGSLTFNGAATLAGNTTLQVNVPTTINGSIGDNFNGYGLTMAGPALLVLGGSASIYSGGTTVNGGTLQLSNANALGSSSGSVGVNGGVLDLHGNSPAVDSVTLAGGSIVNTGTAASLSANSGITLNSGTASAALSGGASVSMNGPGLVLLSGANSYTGGTTVSGGTLQLGNGSALGTPNGSTPLQFTGGLVDLNGQMVTAGGLAGSGGTVTSTSNGGVLILTPSMPANFSGTIAGKAGITLNAPGNSQTLSAANSYSGPTTVSAGTLALAAPGTLGSGLTAIAPGATLDVSAYNPGGYNFTSGTLAAGPTPPGGTDVNGSLNVTGALLAITGGTNSSMTINGNLALASGTVSLTQGSTVVLAGGGALSLAGNDVIEPTGQLSNGTYTLFTYSDLSAGGTNDLAVGGPFVSPRQAYTFATSAGMALTLTVSGFNADLQWNGGSNQTWDTGVSKSWYNPVVNGLDYFYGGDNVTFNDTPGTATIVNINGNVAPGTLTVANTNVAYTFSGTGSIIGTTSLVMTGPGALTINTNNGYIGGTSLGGGLLNLGNSGALGSGTLTISGGSLDNTSGAAMTLAGNSSQNWNNDFTFVGSNPLNLGTGAVTLGTSATVTVSGTGALTVAGAIGDGGNNYALTLPGPGILVLAASNGYGGGTNLNGGLLVLNNNSALGSGPLTISGGSIDSTAGGVTVAGNPLNWNSSFAFLGSQNLNLGTGAVTLGSSLAVTVNAGTLTVGGAIGDNGNGYSLTKAGSGMLNVSGQNTYAGDTMIAQGTLQVGVFGAIPTGAGAGNIDFTSAANAAVLDLNGIDTTVNGLSQPTPSTTNLVVNNLPLSGTNTLTVGNNDATSTFAGILENNTGSGGVLALSKIGAGMLTLGGTNLYTGPTLISGGTLNLLAGTTLPNTTLNFSGTSVVNLNANSQTLANMTFADNTIATITGTTGSSLTCSPASLLIEPATSAATFLTLNMSGVGAFTYHNPTGTVNIGNINGATPTVVTATLSAGTNAITASVLDVGSNESSSTVPSSTLYLGASNSLAVNTINVGYSGDRPQGAVEFAAGLLNPVLTITGASGGTSTTNLNLGKHDSNLPGGGPYVANDLFDTTAGTLYAQFGTVIIGADNTQASASVRLMDYSSTLNMGAGLLTANSMSVAQINSGGTAATAYEFSSSGAFNLSGGTADITTLTLATNNFAYALSGTNNTLSGQVTLNNGAYLYAATIQSGPIATPIVASTGALNVTSQVNFNSGTIGNLTGGSLNMSVASIVVSGTGDQDAFNISNGQTGVVSSTISGSGALASVGPGTLILSGTNNTFTGGLYVPDGTVILTNNEAVADGESLTVGNASLFSTIVPTAGGAASASAVPEPGTLALALATLAAAAVYGRAQVGLFCRKGRLRAK